MNYYILNENKEPVALDDSEMETWLEWMETHNRTVVKTLINPRKPITKGNPKALRTINYKRSKSYLVSTVFLALDHSFSFCDKYPILFETMVFPNDDSLIEIYCDRYRTYDDSLAGHQIAVDLVLRGLLYNGQEAS